MRRKMRARPQPPRWCRAPGAAAARCAPAAVIPGPAPPTSADLRPARQIEMLAAELGEPPADDDSMAALEAIMASSDAGDGDDDDVEGEEAPEGKTAPVRPTAHL